jgi:uncharacterized membrane protein
MPKRLLNWFIAGGALLLMGAVHAGAAAAETNALTAAAATSAAEAFDWRKFLAPFHSVVLHYPIGFITLAFILEIYSFWRNSPELRRIISLVLLLGALTAVMSAGLGLLRAGGGGYDAGMLREHRLYGMLVTGLILVSLALHWWAARPGARRVWLASYRALAVVSLAMLVVAGHLGGNLTHGSRYLVEGAPRFVKDWLDEMDLVELMEDPPAASVGKGIYAEKIRPILAAKCFSCHGPEKQKGDYRLDVAEAAFKGGESGATAIVPGDPFKSNLVRLILLPSDHDDVMPPAGKESLTGEEILAIIQWIQAGAPVAGVPN